MGAANVPVGGDDVRMNGANVQMGVANMQIGGAKWGGGRIEIDDFKKVRLAYAYALYGLIPLHSRFDCAAQRSRHAINFGRKSECTTHTHCNIMRE